MSGSEDRYVAVCALSDMKSGDRRVFETEGQSILLIRMGQHVHAMRNRCSHLDYPLATGRQIGFEIICRSHGARFDIRDGKPLGGPAVFRLPVFKTRVVENRVEVALPVQPTEAVSPSGGSTPRAS